MPDYSVLNSLPGINRVKGVKQLGHRAGNWLSLDQSSEVLNWARGISLRARRNYAMLALLFGCGLRRSELISLEVGDIQMRQSHWSIVDLIGKGGRFRFRTGQKRHLMPGCRRQKSAREESFARSAGQVTFGAADFLKMWFGMSLKSAASRQELNMWLRMIFGEHAPNSATAEVENWSKSNSSWAMLQFRQRSATSVANRTLASQ